MFRNLITSPLSAVALALIVSGVAHASTITIVGDTADARIDVNNTLDGGTLTELRVGRLNLSSNDPNQRAAIFVFSLQAVTEDVATATVNINFVQNNGNLSGFNLDLYGVGFSSSAAAFPIEADFYQGAFGGDVTNTARLAGLHDNFITSSSTQGAYHTSSGGVGTGAMTLAQYINTHRPDGAAGNFLFLRVSADADPGNNQNYRLGAANNSDSARRPFLEITPVPEPASIALLAAGGLLMLGRGRRV